MDLGTKKRTVVKSWVLVFNSDLCSSLETWKEERRMMGVSVDVLAYDLFPAPLSA